MNKRWAPGFTIVEIIIVIVVIGILVAIITVGYGNVRKTALTRAAQSDLQNVSAAMENVLQKTKTYPSAIPDDLEASPDITLTVEGAGTEPYYKNVSAVQNGVLFAKICSDLVNEGLGKGVNQGNETEDYITDCGNWNHGSMQFTGWNTKTWNTPLGSEELLNYGQTFTTTDTWNKAHEQVVKNFYTETVERFQRQGGHFPITTFWDEWADSGNGGVIEDPLPLNPALKPYYCVEARGNGYDDVIWHITHTNKVTEGSC